MGSVIDVPDSHHALLPTRLHIIKRTGFFELTKLTLFIHLNRWFPHLTAAYSKTYRASLSYLDLLLQVVSLY